MNWVGGVRSRLKVKSDKKIQREFFEKKRSNKKFERCTPLQSHGTNVEKPSQGVSLDLVTYNTIVKAYDKRCGFKTGQTDKNPKFVDINKPISRDDGFQFRSLQMSPCNEESSLDLSTASQDSSARVEQKYKTLKPALEETPDITVVYRRQQQPNDMSHNMVYGSQTDGNMLSRQYHPKQTLNPTIVNSDKSKKTEWDALYDTRLKTDQKMTWSNKPYLQSDFIWESRQISHNDKIHQSHSEIIDKHRMVNMQDRLCYDAYNQDANNGHRQSKEMQNQFPHFDVVDNSLLAVNSNHKLTSDVQEQVREMLDIEQGLNGSQLEWESEFSEDELDGTISSATEEDSNQQEIETIHHQEPSVSDGSMQINHRKAREQKCEMNNISTKTETIKVEYTVQSIMKTSPAKIWTSTPSHNCINPEEWLQCMETPSALQDKEINPTMQTNPVKSIIQSNVGTQMSNFTMQTNPVKEVIQSDVGIQTTSITTNSVSCQTEFITTFGEKKHTPKTMNMALHDKILDNDQTDIQIYQGMLIEMFKIEEIDKHRQIQHVLNR